MSESLRGNLNLPTRSAVVERERSKDEVTKMEVSQKSIERGRV